MQATVNRRSPVRPQVYTVLRDAILTSELEPGAALSESDLAARLGVSRTPVREALISLTGEGLIEIYPQLGTFVSKIRGSEVSQLQFIRQTLECASIRLTADRISDERVSELRQVLEEQRRFAERSDYPAFHSVDDVLHRRMAEIAGLPKIWEVVQAAKMHLDRLRRLSLPVPSQMSRLIDEHQAVVDALAARNANAAEQALRLHLDPSRLAEMLKRLGEQHPGYFDDPETIDSMPGAE
jgi:DNA-binding GntR family transcriptional regulator